MWTAKMMPRRSVLVGLSASAALALYPDATRAGAARAVSVGELVSYSRYALVGSAQHSESQWEGADQQRRIVTYSQLEVLQPLDGRQPSDSKLFIRTLGGAVGDIGQVVHGEAEFELGKPAVFFLRPMLVKGVETGTFGVTAMAQGHYPLLKDLDDVLRLTTSRSLADFGTSDPHCAVSRFRGKTVLGAERLIHEELGR
jgi:hypothetical protein